MKPIIFVFVVIIILLFTSYCPAQDVEGSKDHPMFNRLSGFFITDYKEDEFGSHLFYDENDNEKMVEGRKTFIKYESENEVGALKIIRNFANAIKKIGGKALESSGNRVLSKMKMNRRLPEALILFSFWSAAVFSLLIFT